MTTRQQKQVKLLSEYGIANAEDCVLAHARVGGLLLSDCVALLENESGGRNEFGADPGGDALPRAWFDTTVTRAKYTVYKMRRNMGMTPNGVGPCQLTSAGLQKEAERLGGCWKPLHNMVVGFVFLKQLQAERGREGGFISYNGSGPAAIAYGSRAMERSDIWHDRFMRAGLA
jgi:hypothetical protein